MVDPLDLSKNLSEYLWVSLNLPEASQGHQRGILAILNGGSFSYDDNYRPNMSWCLKSA